MTEQKLAKTQKAEVTRREGAEQQRMYVPPADIWETQDEIVVKLDMPGVDKKDIDIKVEAETLTICGKPAEEPHGRLIYADRRSGPGQDLGGDGSRCADDSGGEGRGSEASPHRDRRGSIAPLLQDCFTFLMRRRPARGRLNFFAAGRSLYGRCWNGPSRR